MARRSDGSIPLDPGSMRDLLQIERPVKTRNSFGEDVVTWTLVATVWANVRAMSGAEMERVQQRWALARFKVRTWYMAGIEREYRILWGTRVLDILDAEDPGGLQRELVMTCQEFAE